MSRLRLLGRWVFDQFIYPLWEAFASDRPVKGGDGDAGEQAEEARRG